MIGRDERALRRTVGGAVAGGGVILAAMLRLAGATIGFGWVGADGSGGVDLTAWLVREVEVVGLFGVR